jgi:uncharacterized membrane protein
MISKMKCIQLLEKGLQVDDQLFTLNEEQYVNRKTKFIIIMELVIILLLSVLYAIYYFCVYYEWEFSVFIAEIKARAIFMCNTFTNLLFTNCDLIMTQRHRHLNNILATLIRHSDH